MKRIMLLTLAATAGLAGCGGPRWVRKGSTAFAPSDKVFYGVGRADEAIRSPGLRLEAADNRARADLQRYFDTYTGYLMKEYEGEEGQQVDRVIKTFSAGRLGGVRIVDRHERGDEIYSLAKLDLEEFRRVVRAAPELTEKARKTLIDRAEKLFEQLKDEENRQEDAKN